MSADYSAEGLLADAILDHADDALARTEAALERYDKALAVVGAARALTADMQDWTEQGVLVPLRAALAAFDEVS